MIVFSFYIDRRREFPDAPEYVPLLRILERSCRTFGMRHVVLTDFETAPEIEDAGLATFAMDLPRNITRAATEVHARCLACDHGDDILLTGADCLIRRDFRDHVPPADLAIILRPGHPLYRLNNGFVFVPAASRSKVAPLFRRIADDTRPRMCDDMAAVERALLPMPTDYGPQERAGLRVEFLPMNVWNAGPKRADVSAEDAFVLHFRGRERKKVMVDWAARWLA